MLELPGGPLLVGAAGVGVVAGAAFAVRRGIGTAFLRDLDLRGAGLDRSRFVTRIGRVGWCAPLTHPGPPPSALPSPWGVAYGVPGVLLVVAAARYDPAQPTTLDAGLQALADQPYGPLLLAVLAPGLVAFGVYCLYDARYRKA